MYVAIALSLGDCTMILDIAEMDKILISTVKKFGRKFRAFHVPLLQYYYVCYRSGQGYFINHRDCLTIKTVISKDQVSGTILKHTLVYYHDECTNIINRRGNR